jgi:hypothetical protein
VQAQVVVDEVRQCEEVVVVHEARLEVEVDSMREVAVEEVGVVFQEVEVGALHRGDEVHLEEAVLEEDEARLGVICGKFCIWRSAPVYKITAVV